MFRIKGIYPVLVIILMSISISNAQGDLSSEIRDIELEQEMAWLKAETYVITASRIREHIKKAPASITVITDKQIRQMGAKHLADVVDRGVPGMSNWRYFLGQFMVNARGDVATDSKNVLLMINSHPVNSTYTGGWSWLYDTLIVDNIKRVEIIRGPGSALYGANAFSGVINVITKDAKDIDGLELMARTGSENTQQYNLLYGKAVSDVEVSFNFNYLKTHGFRGLIQEDFLTPIDKILGDGFPPSSLAPGRMDGDDEKYDVALNIKYKGFKFDGRYIDREMDLPVGWVGALNNRSVTPSKDYFVTLSYETTVREGFDVFGKVYRNLYDFALDFQLFPTGTVRFTPLGVPAVWPEGMLWETRLKARRTGIEFQTTYEIGDANSVIAGVTYEEEKSFDISYRANNIPIEAPFVYIHFPSVQDLPDMFVPDSKQRDFKAVFVEHIWDITEDLRLTTGARYDHYSDFGGAFSPRVGLTWEYMKGFDLKLLYGHAFRAPTFYEIYETIGGNPNLDPEEIDTFEVSLGADLTPFLKGRVTFYYKEAKDLIVASSAFSPYNFVNRGKKRDHGFELELKYDFGKGTYLGVNYGYMNFDNMFGGVRHQGDIMANIRLSRYLNFYADLNVVEGLKRWKGDIRGEPSGYEIVNISLIAKKMKGYEGVELRASIYNLFDEDYAYITGPGVLPGDLPAQGVNYMFEIKYRY